MASGDFIKVIGNSFDTEAKLQAFSDITEPFKDEPAFKRIIEMAKTQIAAKIALLADQKAKVVALFETI